MLAALVLAGIVAAPIGTAGLLVQARRRVRTSGAWPAVRRFSFAIGGTVVLAAIVVGALRLLGDSEHLAIDGAAGLVVSSLVWLPVTRRWNARGHLCWSSTIFLFVVYLAFVLEWTFDSHLGAFSTAGGLLLWVFELFAAILACAYLWEICDALGSEHWRRRLVRPEPGKVPDSDLPFVSLHVPAHNEPPDMVLDTLRALLRLDYPKFEVIVIDDNTDEEALWRPLEAWCARHSAKFKHLENWPGYKSGALNYALREMTDPRAEIIGVIDSDYQLEPGFLRRCAPLFADPWVGFTQAPQDYRGWQRARYYRRLYYSYSYFFAVSQPSRNERDGAIFAGTMGLIRRVALEQLGGWDEWCITEDAELSLRLARAGFSGLHVDESWGKGIMPLTFEALKGQRYRWCFGGIQILRMHWRSLLPGRETRANRMSIGQRWSYLSGGLQWYGDLLGLLFLVFLLAGAANLALGGGELFRKLTAFLVATVPVLVLLGLIRAVALLRRGTGASWRDALGAFFIWQSTSLVVARASVLALFARKAAFLRTPKTSEKQKWWEALRANWAESALALLGLLGIGFALSRATELAGILLAGLLLFPTLGMAAAPFNSWAAQRAALPADLTAWRTMEWKRSRHRRAVMRGAAVGGLVTVGAVAAAAVALLYTPGTHPVQPPQLVTAPKHASPASHSSPSPAPSSSSPTPTTSPTHSPAPVSSSPAPASSSPAPASSSPPPASSSPAATSSSPPPASSSAAAKAASSASSAPPGAAATTSSAAP
ncbi:MAG TPA: glycosyltransferase [Streptosporangiaceae bacterium]|nr:glycosyltransferase [Streptosporangiaceae bacterium]